MGNDRYVRRLTQMNRKVNTDLFFGGENAVLADETGFCRRT
jgi:hypothetical protein